MSFSFQNIRYSTLCIASLISVLSCRNESIELYSDANDTKSVQEIFARKLKANGLLAYDSAIAGIIDQITNETSFKQRFQINGEFDSTRLNFYTIDSKLDTTLSGLCAFAGNNTIYLDLHFLNTFLNDKQAYLNFKQDKTSLYSFYFQFWVISHEISHAELNDTFSHFIVNFDSKDQRIQQQRQAAEFRADQNCVAYLKELNQDMLMSLMIGLFKYDMDKNYQGIDLNSPFKNLLISYDPYDVISYRLPDHPMMAIRTAIFMYLMSADIELREESYLFLIMSQLHFIQEMNYFPEDSSLRVKLSSRELFRKYSSRGK